MKWIPDSRDLAQYPNAGWLVKEDGSKVWAFCREFAGWVAEWDQQREQKKKDKAGGRP